MGQLVAELKRLGASDDQIVRIMTGGVTPEGLREALNESPEMQLLAAIGSGDNPIAQALNGVVEGTVDISMERFPEQTIAVLNVLAAIGGAADVTVRFFDDATGNAVSKAWNQLTPTEQNAILGGTLIASVAIPEVAVAKLQALKVGRLVTAENFFDGTHYTSKVLNQAASGDYHGFPQSVDAFSGTGTVSALVGGDGITRWKLTIPGTYDGKSGVFEYIRNPDGSINHRLFVPRN
jgi:hypothetical protein